MSKIISQTFPGTDTIPLSGGRFNIYSQHIKTDFNDLFIGGYDEQVWQSFESSGAEEILSPRYHIRFNGPSNCEAIFKSQPYDVPEIIRIGLKVRFTEFIEPYTGPAIILLGLVSTDPLLLQSLLFKYEFDYSTGQANVSYFTGPQTLLDPAPSKNEEIDISVVFETANGTTKGSMYVNGKFILSNVYDFTDLQIRNYFAIGGLNGIDVYPVSCYSHPVFKGVPSSSTQGHILADSVSEGLASISVLPDYPGAFEVFTGGSGSGSQSAFKVGDIQVSDSSNLEDSMKFLISPVEKFYTDSEPILACRRFGIPDPANNGSLIVNNRCVCDGSDEDGSATYIDFVRGGNTSDDNIADAPIFKFVDEDGKQYGCNYEFQRIHDLSSQFTTSPNPILDLRCLTFESGNRLYYGLRKSSDSSDNFNSVKIKVQAIPAWNPFYKGWKLYRLLQNSRELIAEADTYSEINYTINQANSQLTEGYYCLYFINGEASVSFGNSGGSYKELYSLRNRDDSVFDLSEIKASRLFFEVKNYFGNPIFYYFNRCRGIFKGFELYSSVQIEPNSFSAIEIGRDKIAFLFQGREESDDPAKLLNFKTYVNYVVYNFNNETSIPVPARLYLPQSLFQLNDSTTGNKKIFAFDAVKTADNLVSFNFSTIVESDFFYFRQNNKRDSSSIYKGGSTDANLGGDFEQVNPVENNSFFERSLRGIRYRPFLESGFNSITFSINDHDFSGQNEYINSQDFSTNKAVSIERAMVLYNPDNIQERFTRSGACFIRSNFDKSSGMTLVSTIDTQRRMPFIYAGSRNKWRDLCVPEHFNTYKAFTDFSPQGFSNFIFTSIRSIDATFGYDGNVYSVCVKGPSYPKAIPVGHSLTVGASTELGIIDPSILESSENNFINFRYRRQVAPYAGNFSDGTELSFYSGRYRQHIIPMLSSYRSVTGGDNDSSHGFSSCSISLDNNYLVCSFGHKESYLPVIYQAFNQDQVPFFCQPSEVLSPPYVSGTSWAYIPSAVSINSQRIAMVGQNSEISRTLTSSSTPQSLRLKPREGYKFHVRARVKSGTPNSVNIMTLDVRIPLTSTAGETRLATCRMVRNENTITCYVPFDAEQPVHTFTGIDGNILDYYILIQGHQDNRFRVSFVLKRNPNQLDADWYDFHNESQIFTYISDDYIDQGLSTQKFTIKRGSNTDASSSSTIEIFQADISLMRQSNLSDGFPGLNRYPSGTTQNDYKIFDITNLQNDDPIHLYRARSAIDTSLTRYAHWPNGFEFCFSDYSASKNDRFTLQRESIYNINSLISNRIHGTWRSQGDSSSVIIYADSNDSGYETFMFDALVLEGANFEKFTIIGSNDLSQPWQDLAEVSLIKYNLDGLTYTEGEDYTIVHGEYDFNIGKFDWRNYYFYSDDYEVQQELFAIASFPIKASKILKEEYDRIWITRGRLRSRQDGVVLTSKTSKLFDSVQSFRYVGIRIPPFRTYEGYFKLESLDFGKIREIPLKYNHDISKGQSFKSDTNVYFVEDEQAISRRDKKVSKSYDLSYSIADGNLYMKIISAMEAVTLKRKPIWIIDHYLANKEEFALCLASKDVGSEVLVDEDGEKYYKIDIGFRSVKGE
jgi:hypothetical protein